MTRVQSTLWHCVHRETKAVIYLFGTIHLPSNTIQWPETPVLSLIESSDIYFGEMDLDESSNTLNNSYHYIDNDLSVKDFMSEKEYDRIQKILLKAFEINLKNYSNLKPLLFQSLIDNAIVGTSTFPPLDIKLWNFAKRKNIPVFGLESFQRQLDILNQIPIEDQILNLRKLTRNVSLYRKKVNKMIHHYNIMDINAIYRYARKNLGNMRILMINERNQRMLKTIYQMDPGKTHFISVGAGHLPGNHGILSGLKRNGWKVSAIIPN